MLFFLLMDEMGSALSLKRNIEYRIVKTIIRTESLSAFLFIELILLTSFMYTVGAQYTLVE